MKIYYGIEGKWTEVDKMKCFMNINNNYCMISGDVERSKIFGIDPLVYVLKSIKIEFNKDNSIIINHNEECIFDENNIIAHSKQLGDLHQRLKINHGTFAEEYPEQVMTILFLKPKNRVLEIGGNIGRNSLIIASILKDSRNLLVLESDVNNANILQQNRDLNKSEFRIEPAALSKRKLIQRDWTTKPSDNLIPGWSWISTITYEQLIVKYPISFDTLVLDCEGAFYWILKDYPEILQNIRLIIMENDYKDVGEYNYIENVLVQAGFTNIYTKSLGINFMPCDKYFYQVWVCE